MIDTFWKSLKKFTFELVPVFAASLSVGVGVSYLFDSSSEKPKDIYPEFRTAVVQLLTDKPQLESNDVQLLASALYPSVSENRNMNSLVRFNLVKLHYDVVSGKNKEEHSAEQRNAWGGEIKKVIGKLDEISPFQRLHPIEASVFQDISALNENPELDRKLMQLSSLVQARFEELEAAKSEARWSLIFGIAGVVGAIVSIFLSVMQPFSKKENA